MPVRVKHRASPDNPSSNEKEWEKLITTITSYVLASPRVVDVSVSDEGNGRVLKVRDLHEPKKVDLCSRKLHKSWRACSDLRYVLNVLTQASLIAQASWPSWVPVSAKTTSIVIKGGISLDPAPNKQAQFISVGIRPLASNGTNSMLYGLINRLFSLSRFGATEDMPDNRYKHNANTGKDVTQRQLKGVRKGIDKWPMFCLWIQFSGPEIADFSTKDTDEIAVSSSQIMADVIEVMVTRWLDEHHFRLPQHGRKSVNPGAHVFQPATPTKPVPLTGTRSQSVRSTVNTSAWDNVPNFQAKSVDSNHKNHAIDFSSWTRIKNGMSSNATGRKPKTVGIGSVPAILDDQHDVARGCGCDGIHNISSNEFPGSSSLCKREQSFDDLVPWQHPMSKDVYMLNIRSGIMFKQGENIAAVNRPDSAPSTASTNKILNAMRIQRPSSSNGTSSAWLSGLADKWKNPVFKNNELHIPQVSLQTQLPEGSSKSLEVVVQSTLGQNTVQRNIRLSSACLRSAEVLEQLDRKFILLKVTIPNESEESRHDAIAAQSTVALVLVDQHAADERCKVEILLEEISSPQKATVQLQKPITFMVSSKEASLFEQAGSMFSQWGIIYSVSPEYKLGSVEQCSDRRITVKGLPSGIYERCISNITLLTELLRGEAWNYWAHKVRCQERDSVFDINEKHSWLRRIGSCPKGIVDMLNSRACRSAIMFNDMLTNDECRDLINRLSHCAFPFQCAHGRPSMVPLIDIGSLNGANSSSSAALDVGVVDQERRSIRSQNFSDAFKQWRSGAHNDEEWTDT